MSELHMAVPAVLTGPAVISPAAAVKETATSAHAERKYLRGSYLLLAGRFFAAFLNLATQVLTVRYLTKADYGSFAYALAVVAMGSVAVQLGMGKSIPRLVPIYFEKKDFSRTFGSIALATATIWGLGIACLVLVLGLRGVIAGSVIDDPRSLSLLLIMIALAPVGAYTAVLEKLVAVFVSARAIFFRRHVLAPGLKLAAVLAVILTSGSVHMLAWGYLAGGAVGVWIYSAILLKNWRKRGLLHYLQLSRLQLPVRELFGFSLPLLTSELSVILRGAFIVILLEYFHASGSVAEYRAVLPVAGLNTLVYEAFFTLFVPVASRMFARNERDAISELFWKTSMWIAVVTLPVFAVTFALAEPVTRLLFGTTYAGAGTILAVLAVGYYFHAAVGFNAPSLQVHGKLRLIVVSDLVAAVALVALAFLLIPRYGALGAALTLSGAVVFQNILYNICLWLGNTGISVVEWQFVRVYLLATAVMATLLLVQRLLQPSLYMGIALAGVLSVLVLRLTRHTLKPAETFPELLRMPVVRQLLT
jgi:O-antigen/teichoic acid export membrane protein